MIPCSCCPRWERVSRSSRAQRRTLGRHYEEKKRWRKLGFNSWQIDIKRHLEQRYLWQWSAVSIMCVESREWMKFGGNAFFCLTTFGLLKRDRKAQMSVLLWVAAVLCAQIWNGNVRRTVSDLKWPHYQPCSSLPVRQLAKQYWVCARYVLHKRAVLPEDAPILIQSRVFFDRFLSETAENDLRALQNLLLLVHSSEDSSSFCWLICSSFFTSHPPLMLINWSFMLSQQLFFYTNEVLFCDTV